MHGGLVEYMGTLKWVRQVLLYRMTLSKLRSNGAEQRGCGARKRRQCKARCYLCAACRHIMQRGDTG